MNFLFAFLAALVISMIIVPVMVRLAPRLGMIDRPEPRKVHVAPIPRVGGIGIVFGTLVPIILWLPLDEAVQAFLFGSAILLVFGAWDDARELGPYIKFFGQFMAALVVVYYGDVYVTHLPLMGLEPVSETITKPFTVLALVGVINALNTSDGLDGLAGGESLLSIGGLAYLAYLADGTTVMFIALATLGGIFGFLRYNSHPARVFMGDGGSQFLGFCLGFLAIFFVQRVNQAMSPAIVALVIGLPIIDIIAVMVQRSYYHLSWFRPTKTHIHHRLLGLGFDHYESVVIIYSIQAFFVVSAIFLLYEADWLILILYLGVCSLLLVFLATAERKGWQAHRPGGLPRMERLIELVKGHRLFKRGPVKLVSIAIPGFLVAGSLWAQRVPLDFAYAATGLFSALIVGLILSKKNGFIFLRIVIYATVAFLVYLTEQYPVPGMPGSELFQYLFFGGMAVLLIIALRQTRDEVFKMTPMDFLVVLVVLFFGILSEEHEQTVDMGMLLVKVVIMFYGSELLINRMVRRWNSLTLSTLGALAVLSVRGFL